MQIANPFYAAKRCKGAMEFPLPDGGDIFFIHYVIYTVSG
jgi:hypothetical protein